MKWKSNEKMDYKPIIYMCVASLQNSPLVGRNESGIIHDLSKNNFFYYKFFIILFND